MPRQVAPIPVQTPPIEGGKPWTITYSRWFKTVSDFAVDATRVQQQPSLNLTIVGCLVHIEYNGAGGSSVELPYNALATVYFDAFDGSTWSKIAATAQPNGRYAFTVPAGDNVHVSGNYLTALSSAAS